MSSEIKADKWSPASGTAGTIGDSGDTFTVPSGATLAVASGATISNSGTATGFGMSDLAPYFSARQTNNQSISNGTMTKVEFPTEIADSGSVFDNSTNYRFTPGVVGKYMIGANVTVQDVGDGKKVQLAIYENGSNMNSGQAAFMNTSGVNDNLTVGGTWVLDVDNTSNYYEIYIYHNKGTSQQLRGDFFNNFYGYKIG
jgi:hypothetical protein